MERINLKLLGVLLFTFLFVGTLSAQYDTTNTGNTNPNTGTGYGVDTTDTNTGNTGTQSGTEGTQKPETWGTPGNTGTQGTYGQDTSSTGAMRGYSKTVDEATDYLVNTLNLRSQQISQIRNILISYSENLSGEKHMGRTEPGTDTSAVGTQEEMLGGVTRDNLADKITDVLDEEQKTQFEQVKDGFMDKVDEIKPYTGTEEEHEMRPEHQMDSTDTHVK